MKNVTLTVLTVAVLSGCGGSSSSPSKKIDETPKSVAVEHQVDMKMDVESISNESRPEVLGIIDGTYETFNGQELPPQDSYNNWEVNYSDLRMDNKKTGDKGRVRAVGNGDGTYEITYWDANEYQWNDSTTFVLNASGNNDCANGSSYQYNTKAVTDDDGVTFQQREFVDVRNNVWLGDKCRMMIVQGTINTFSSGLEENVTKQYIVEFDKDTKITAFLEIGYSYNMHPYKIVSGQRVDSPLSLFEKQPELFFYSQKLK
ncbi:hypothetical protein [Vibrio halioticoli]|uniref:hypothetical protein n=1 Tax=Vibrio halioticoli TaxID=71388 RepID=UPI000E5ADFF1|nr:hypothetical protein [Vibrio halioticoli]